MPSKSASGEKVYSRRPGEAREAALRALNGLKWQPRRDGADGFAAVWTSPVFRFKDDVSVRLEPAPNATRVFVRSSSRVGLYDFGQNARHVQDFFTALEGELGR